MGKLKIDRLTIGGGSRHAEYSRAKSSQDLFFEDAGELDLFKVTLVAGTYGHNDQPLEEGTFDADLSFGASWQGHVVSSLADRTAEGAPESITLILKVER